MGLYHFKRTEKTIYIEQGLFAVLYDDANSPMNKLDFALLVCLFVCLLPLLLLLLMLFVCHLCREESKLQHFLTVFKDQLVQDIYE